MADSKVAVIVAAYNEERHISDVVQRIRSSGFDNIIVVSDGSRDKTVKLALAEGVTVLEHITNLGKGAALKTGVEYAIRMGAQALVFVDGDGQHEPEEIPKFVDALKSHDIAFGARQRSKRMPLILRFGNRFLSGFIALLYGIKLDDSQCGFRAVRASAYPLIVWNSTGYTVESEMVAWAGKAKLSYIQVPIKTIYHDKYKGTTALDGFPIAWNMLMWRFHRRGRRLL